MVSPNFGILCPSESVSDSWKEELDDVLVSDVEDEKLESLVLLSSMHSG